MARLLHSSLLPAADVATESVNGRAGNVLRRAGRALAVITTSQPAILWLVLNPAKLRRWHRPG